MPGLQYWFTGGALAAGLALFATVITLGYAWYRAAETEQQTASSKAKSDAGTKRLREVREQLGSFLAEGHRLIVETQKQEEPPPTAAAEDWQGHVISFLEANIGQFYAHRFVDTSGLPMGLTTLQSDAHRRLEGGLKTRTARLQQFLAEITSDHLR